MPRPVLAALALAPVLVSLAPGPGGAQILVLGQDRRVASSSFVSSALGFDVDQLQEVAPDGGPFDVTLATDASIPDASASAAGAQTSSLSGVSILAAGAASADAAAGEGAIAYASAQSNVAIRFSLEHPSAYSITGFLEASGTAATLQLARPFETLAWFRAEDETLELDAQGTMEAGVWDLNITCGAGAAAEAGTPASPGSAAYDVLFLVGGATGAPAAAPAAPALRAFPNPFRASTRLDLPDGVSEVRVIDATGRRVRTLAASAPALVFDGRDAAGRPLASGVYWLAPIGDATVVPVRVVRLR